MIAKFSSLMLLSESRDHLHNSRKSLVTIKTNVATTLAIHIITAGHMHNHIKVGSSDVDWTLYFIRLLALANFARFNRCI